MGWGWDFSHGHGAMDRQTRLHHVSSTKPRRQYAHTIEQEQSIKFITGRHISQNSTPSGALTESQVPVAKIAFLSDASPQARRHLPDPLRAS
jgi:hypothetical protein